MNKSIFKKFLLLITAAGLIFSLTACEGQSILTPKPPDLNKNFEFTADITCGDQEFSAWFGRNGVGKWQAALTQPYEVQGVNFTYNKGTAAASFEGITIDNLNEDFSSSPICAIITELENAVQDINAAVIYKDGGYTVQTGNTVLSFAQGTAQPESFEISSEGIKGTVTDFKITGEIFEGGADIVLVN